MKLKKIIIGFILFFFTVATGSAQEQEEEYILSKIAKFYEANDSYAYEVNYKMYRGYEKDSLTENYTSTFIKNGLRLKMSFLEYDLHLFQELQLTISKKEKVIYVNDVSIDLNPANLAQAFNRMRQFCEIVSFEKNGKYAFMTMVPKLKNVYPYNKIKLKINVKKNFIEEQDLFFVKKLHFEDSKGNIGLHNACLNISCKEKKNVKKDLPNINYFLNQLNSNKEIRVSSNFNEFGLIDQRRK